jgi:hypothetical protein
MCGLKILRELETVNLGTENTMAKSTGTNRQTDKQWSAKYHKEKLKFEQHEPQKNWV